MRTTLPLKTILLTGLFSFLSYVSYAQTGEWRLVQTFFNATDPDGGGGPATGVVRFQLQLRATAGSFTATDISTGFSWQSANAMLPTTAVCAGSPPGNITVSPEFSGAGYNYTSVNQCNAVNFSTGGQTFDRTAAGSLDPSGGSVVITTTWMPVFTVELWTLGNSNPEGGYVVVNSTATGTPGPLSSYAVADNNGDEVPVNSVTFTTPLAIGPSAAPLPVRFTRFNAQCSDNGAVISWNTAFEQNNSHYEIEKSSDGTTWTNIGRINAIGNSSNNSQYQFTDKAGGPSMYRVKQVDIDGSVSYTSLARTTCNSKAFFVNLYPVPVKDRLTVVIGSDRTANALAQVLDNTGRVVMSVRLAIVKGTNNFTLNVGRLAQGQYYLRSNHEGLSFNQQFTINR